MAENCPFEITPLAYSKPIKNTNIHSLSYVNQDFWSLKSRMLELLQQNFHKDFNDFTESSLAIMLVEMWAFIADQLSFKIDQLANEMFIDTVTESHNAFRLAKLLGYKPTPPLPARAMFVITLNHSLSHDLEIKAPLILSYPSADGTDKTIELYQADMNNNPIMDRNIIIPVGSVSSSNIVGIEGRTMSLRMDGSGIINQVIKIDSPSILMNSIRVSIDGVPWEVVESFTESHPRREYRVEYTPDYKAFIFFGDNISGLIPPKSSKISIFYRIGGGESGNIVTGAIDKSIPVNVPGIPYAITANVKNYTKAEFGYDGDQIEDIRRKIPLYLRTQGRAVTGEDYKYLADSFATSYNGAIGKALAVLRNHGCAGNIIDIYILARDGRGGLSKANSNLKQELTTELWRKKMLTDHVCLRDGEIVLVDISIEIIVDRFQRQYEGSIRDRIERRIEEFFALANWEFGQILRDSDIIKTLADVREVEQFDITFTTERSLDAGHGSIRVVEPKYYEILRPDSIQVNFSYKTENK
jgi:hypothetical protein